MQVIFCQQNYRSNENPTEIILDTLSYYSGTHDLPDYVIRRKIISYVLYGVDVPLLLSCARIVLQRMHCTNGNSVPFSVINSKADQILSFRQFSFFFRDAFPTCNNCLTFSLSIMVVNFTSPLQCLLICTWHSHRVESIMFTAWYRSQRSQAGLCFLNYRRMEKKELPRYSLNSKKWWQN
jgi:hypothetical protein